MNIRLDQMPEWAALREHASGVRHRRIRTLFEQDPQRFSQFSATAAGILLDYSRQNVDRRTMDLLLSLARASQVEQWRQRQFGGENINRSEDRAVLHTALRTAAPDMGLANIHEQVVALHGSMDVIANRILSGQWKGATGKPIRSVINIGIGGSDLGPAMVCRALTRDAEAPEVRFLSNIDPAEFAWVTRDLDPETTLFILASKTFTTLETMSNAELARQWIADRVSGTGVMAKHFVAVTGNTERAKEFGVDGENILPMPDWIGGRFSLWSGIGLPIALHIGMAGFRSLLAGARKMDTHFLQAPLKENLPVLLALLGIWNRNFRQADSLAVVPYCQALEQLPNYLQQLEMESNGKGTTRDGERVDWSTCPVIWGSPGTNAQHAFFQQLHQGTDEIPVDFVVVKKGPAGREALQRKLVANAVAQSAALALGRETDEVEERLIQSGMAAQDANRIAPHRTYPGNRPSSMLILDELSAESLGALLSLFEHKVLVQGVIWQIHSYDQWGVELGKEMATAMDGVLAQSDDANPPDAVVKGLVDRLR